MKKLFKILFWVLGISIGLIALTAVLIPLLLDPNDHKERIGSLVKQHTGRDLNLQGNIKLSVFPWLGMELGEASLGNAEGFSAKEFAKIKNVQVRVKLMPLLDKQVEADTLVLDGVQIFLQRNKEGRGNWEDLAKPKAKTQANEPQAKPEQMPSLAINGLELRNADIHWDDEMLNKNYKLKQLNFKTGAVAMHKPLDFELDSLLDLGNVSGKLSLSARFQGNLNKKQYVLKDLKIGLDAEGGQIPGGSQSLRLVLADLSVDALQMNAALQKLDVQLAGLHLKSNITVTHALKDLKFTGDLALEEFNPRGVMQKLGQKIPPAPENMLKSASLSVKFNGDMVQYHAQDMQLKLDDNQLNIPALAYDAAAGRAALEQFVLQLAGMKLIGSAKASNLPAAPEYQVNLDVAGFNPEEMLKSLNIPLPRRADAKTLQHAALKADISGSLNRVKLNSLSVELDETKLSGDAAVDNFAAPAIRFHLKGNTFNADRYLPPKPQEPQKGSGESPQPPVPQTDNEKQDQPLPLDMLRQLNLDGTVELGYLQVNNVKAQDIKLHIKGKDGQVELNSGAQLYGGNLGNRISLNANSTPPLLTLDESLQNIQAGPLLDDLQNGQGKLSGTTTLTAQLQADAATLNNIRNSLRGNVGFNFQNGAYKGFNLGEELRKAKALAKGEPMPPAGLQQTDFTELSGSFQVQNSVFHTQDLMMNAPLLRLSGSGNVAPLAQTMAMRLDTSVVGTSTGQGGKALDELRGITIPVTVGGSFQQPNVGVDTKALLAGLAKGAASRALSKDEEKIKRKLQEKLGEKAGGQVLEGLKGLFK